MPIKPPRVAVTDISRTREIERSPKMTPRGYQQSPPPVGNEGWLPPGRQREKQFTTENDRIDLLSVRGIFLIIVGIGLLTLFSALLADTISWPQQ